MAIDVKLNGKPKWNASDYSVAEDSTPLDPSDTSGGTGQFTVSLPETSESKMWQNKPITLADGAQGTTLGKVASVGGEGSTATLTVDSRMAALNVERVAQPYSGTLEGLFRYYLGLVGIDTDIAVETVIATRPIVAPGWSGNVWDQVKAVMSSQMVETSLVSNQIVLRPVRTRIAQNYRDSAESWNISTDSIAQSIEIYYYQSALRQDLAYPLGGWTSDVQTYQVDAGAKVTFDISLEPEDDSGDESDDAPAPSTLGLSLVSIEQPVCVSSVGPAYSATSVYTVSGNDGLPITPAQWAADGGNLSVSISEDSRSITLAITGPKTAEYAPYTIGMPSGDNTYYSSLRIRGVGVFYDRQKLTLLTGNSEDVAPTEIGATVDNPFIRTADEAFHAGLRTLATWTGPQRSVQVSTAGINRRGDVDSYAYLTMGQMNIDPDFAGKTMGQINQEFAGLTMGQINALQKAKVASNFENQAFGNVAGARVYNDGSWYRIRSVGSIAPTGVSYTAQADDIIDDFNASYAGFTVAQFNAKHAGKTVGDFNARPFFDEPPVILVPSEVLYPADNLFPS